MQYFTDFGVASRTVMTHNIKDRIERNGPPKPASRSGLMVNCSGMMIVTLLAGVSSSSGRYLP